MGLDNTSTLLCISAPEETPLKCPTAVATEQARPTKVVPAPSPVRSPAEAPFDLDSECPICLCPCEEPCRAACGHVFCSGCISGAMRCGSGPAWRGRCPMCRARVSGYSLRHDATHEPLLGAPLADGIYGQCFERDGVGQASLHFSESGSYISYENEACVAFPDLDDSSCQPPARKAFTDETYDSETRVFRATVFWEEFAPGGESEWEYEMHFADDFTAIVDGELRAFDADGNLCRTQLFREDGAKTDLCYSKVITADDPFGHAFVQMGVLGFASYHFVSEQEGYISYEAEEVSMLPPLDDGSRVPARKSFSNMSYDAGSRTLRATVSWDPAGWFGSAAWELEMVFSEDFAAIGGGEVRQFAAAGDREPTAVIPYGMGPTYARCHPGALALFAPDA